MVSTKIGIAVGVAIAIIGGIAIFATSDTNSESTPISEENTATPEIIESDNGNYYINDEGRKVFVIEARDSLQINE